jgi:hypothetical protein
MQTIEKLKVRAEGLLKSARENMLEDNVFVPIILVGDATDNAPDMFIAVQGEIMNSGEEKEKLAQTIKEGIKVHNYGYVVSLFDTFQIRSKSSEEMALVTSIQRKTGMSLKDIHNKFKLGELKESLIALVETPLLGCMYSQAYERGEDGKVKAFDEIESNDQGLVGGRFQYFSQIPLDKNGKRVVN